MKIVKGTVQGVVTRNEGTDKEFVIVGIGSTTKNRNGFDETQVMEFQIRGEQLKAGLHNAYRTHAGAEVYAPYSDEIDTYFKDNPRIRYQLQGAPLRIQEVTRERAQEQRPAAVPQTGAPAQKTA